MGGEQTVRSVRADVGGDLDRLRNVIDDLAYHAWKGGASFTFTQVMADWDKNAKTLMQALEEIANMLKGSDVQFSVNEDQSKSLMNQYIGALDGSLGTRR